MIRLGPSLVMLALLASCAGTREARVRSALNDAGLPPRTAECMAEPLARDLSNDQLRSIARVAKAVDGRGRQLSDAQFLDLLRREVDAETVTVVVRAGVGCFLRG